MQPQVDLDKVISLFTGPNSEDLYDRHLAAIERLCKNNVGFPIRDLPKVQQILEITLRLLLKGVSSFLQPAVDLIRVLTKPFVKKTATDEFRLLGNISSILSCVSQIFVNSAYPQDLQLAASEMLIVFASGYGQRPSLLDKFSPIEQADSARSRQYHTNQMLISSSGALVTVVQSLAKAVAAYDEVLMMALSLVATQISYFPDNASALLDAGLLQSLPHLLSYDYRHPLTPVAVQLLWNLLDFAPVATRVGLVSTPALESQPGPFSGSTTSPRPEAAAETAQGSAEQDGAPQQQPGTNEHSSHGREERRAPSPRRAAEQQQQQQQQSQRRSTAGGFPQPMVSLESRPSKGTLRRVSNSPPVSILPAVATSLTSLFRANLLHGCRAVDKELRNDLVVVCSLIIGSDHPEPPLPTSHGSKSASSPQEESELLQLCSMEFIEAAREVGFFEALLAVSTSPELGLLEHEGLVKAWALSTEDLDYELRQLAWRAVVAGCVHAGPGDAWLLLDAVRAWSLVRVLLAFIEEVPEAAPHPALAAAALSAQRRWSSDQMDTLRGMALARLHALAPLCPEVYVEEGGPSVLLRFLSNSVHAAHMEGALRHLHNLLGPHANMRSFSEESGMAEVLGAAGAMAVLLGLLKDGSRPENVRHCCLLLLAALCRMGGVDAATRLRCMIGEASLRSPTRTPTRSSLTSQQGTRRTSNTNISCQGTRRRASLAGGDVEPSVSNLRRFRHEGGVDVVLAQLARCQSADRTLPSPYTIAVLDVVWTCVVPDRKNTARFLVEDGLDALLTLLEVGNRGHRAVGLSLLADILTNPRSHSFFHEWRSHQDQSTAAHLLLRIWKEEDQASGISDQQGILTNTSLPLRGTGKPATWVVPEAIAYGNLLPKGNAGAATQHLGASAGPLTGVRVASPTGGGATARLVPAPHMQLHPTSPRTQPPFNASVRSGTDHPRSRSPSPLARTGAHPNTATPSATNDTQNVNDQGGQNCTLPLQHHQQQQSGSQLPSQGGQGSQLVGRNSGPGLSGGGLATERSSLGVGGWQSSRRLSREGTESALGVADAAQQAALVQGLESRGAKVAAMLAASSGEPLLAKVYSCFNLLGFGNFDYLPPADGILLTLVEKYVKFKQGEMWVSIANNFEASGIRPTAPDRERLASGIELSEHLAAAVRDAQLAMLGREAEVAAQKEAKFYEDMRAQRKLEQESRFFKQDKSQLTLAEIRQAKEKKETMLRNSIRDFRMSPLTIGDDD